MNYESSFFTGYPSSTYHSSRLFTDDYLGNPSYYPSSTGGTRLRSDELLGNETKRPTLDRTPDAQGAPNRSRIFGQFGHGIPLRLARRKEKKKKERRTSGEILGQQSRLANWRAEKTTTTKTMNEMTNRRTTCRASAAKQVEISRLANTKKTPRMTRLFR